MSKTYDEMDIREWLDHMSESVTVELTRSDLHNIMIALARAANAARKPHNERVFHNTLLNLTKAYKRD